MIGILGAHGHSLDILETHSWDQVSLLAECIVQNEISKLEMLLSPLAAAMGVEYKSGDKKQKKTVSKEDQAKKEASLVAFARMNGLMD